MAGARKRGRPAGAAKRGATGSSPSGRPWQIRYSDRILTDDLRDLGHPAYENAKKAIRKKLPVDPHQYGDGLRPPLDGIYKLKSSHVRVAYHIEEATHEVWVLMIADRRTIWDHNEDEILGRFAVMRGRPAATDVRKGGKPAPGSRKKP